MWSHYADHHKGICVGVRPECIGRGFRSVEYVEDVPVLDVKDYVTPSPDILHGEKFIRLSLAKSLRWRYEKEWRSISKAGPDRFPGSVAHVVVGALASRDTRESVSAAVEESKQDIQIFQAELSDKYYALDIRPAKRLSGVSQSRSEGAQNVRPARRLSRRHRRGSG